MIYDVDVTNSELTRDTSALAADLKSLDATDHALIQRLQSDGRIPSAQLARELRLDQRTVRRRIQDLIENEVIRIAAVADPRALGYTSMALISLSTTSSVSSGEVFDYVGSLPEVDYVTRAPGPFSMQAEVMCETDQALTRVLTENFEDYVGIDQIDVLYYLRLHFQRSWFTEADKGVLKRGVRPMELTTVDRGIVSILARDGRATFTELASKLNISESLARKRYTHLVDTDAMRVVAIANPLQLGYRGTSWVALDCSSAASVTEVAEALTEISEVSYVAITAGRFDLFVEIICQNHEHLLSVVDSQVRKIFGIRRLEIWPYLELRYKPLLPSGSQLLN